MSDKSSYQDRLQQNAHLAGQAGAAPKKDAEAEELSCAAFGYLRGIRDKAANVEFRLKSGNCVWFPYSWLGPCRFNPSEGLLMKFSGDLVYLVLIRGSNLDLPLNAGNMNLTAAGLQRHRIVWIREMSAEDIRKIGNTEPTIDRIDIAEFESPADAKDWLRSHAPGFMG